MSETHVDPMWVQISYLVAAVLFILALKSMSSPRTARTGVLIGAIGAALATGVLFFSGIKLANLALIVGFLVVGSVLGLVAARRVKMTAMPQLVALFNGVGGGAAALIAVVEYLVVDSDDLLFLIFTVATVIVGSIAFSGSIVTYLKLQELMTTRPVVIPLGKWITILVAVATVVGGVWLIVQPQEWLLWALLGL